jgi:beta-lactam-binding protein with PASTA domain
VVPGTRRLVLNLRIPPVPEPQRTVVPAVKGLSSEEALQLVSEARLRPNFSGAKDGLAGDPSPAAGTVVDPGTAVAVIFAVPPVLVPPLKGLTLDAARLRLAETLLQPGAVHGDHRDGATVESQSPEPLTVVERGSLVEVTMVALAPPQVPVPDVTKKSCAEARSLIVAAGLRTAWKECPRGSVLVEAQIPVSGTMVDARTMVSTFYASVAVPRLVGLSSQTAVDRLTLLGLAGVISAPKDWDSAKSVVASQFPQQGVLVDVGSEVTLAMRNLLWWELVPVWVWVAIGVAGLAGLLYLIVPPPPPVPRPPGPAIPAAVVTFQPHSGTSMVRLGDERGPKVRLIITLRDHPGQSRMTVEEKSAAKEMEVS